MIFVEHFPKYSCNSVQQREYQ